MQNARTITLVFILFELCPFELYKYKFLRQNRVRSVKFQVHDQIIFAKDCMPCNRLCRNCSCYWSIFVGVCPWIKVYRYNPTEIYQQRLQGVRNVAQKLCSWERSLTLKPFKVSSWNFIQILTNIRRRAEYENHNSCIDIFWVISLWTF